jgi:hypothetical protein
VFAELTHGLRVRIGAEFPLTDAGHAQSQLEQGTTTGSILLIP